MDSEAVGWIDRAMAVSGEAFAAGHYEAAYHALMAALHLAQDLGDEGRLLRVARVAGEQGRHIDTVSPSHRLSSQTARARGSNSVFEYAVRQATTEAKMVAATHCP